MSPLLPERPSLPDHNEAVRLAWLSRHLPVGTLMIGILLLAGILSAIFSMLAVSPSSGIP